MKRALVLSLICVIGLTFGVFAQTLSGTWNTKVCINPQTAWANALTLTSTLSVDYEIGDWTFGTVIAIDEAGWKDMDFTVDGMFGLITVDSALGFTVGTPPGFDSWVTTLTLNMAGVSFSGTFTLKTGAVDLDLTMTAGLGSAVEGEIVLGLGGGDGCDFDFQDVKIGLDFLFCECASIESEIYFTCLTGFEYIKFCTSGIAVPTLPWLTLDACLQFETQTKTLTITPKANFGTIVCFDLFFSLDDDSAATFPNDTVLLSSIEIVGIGITCDLPGGVTFAGLSKFDGSIPGGYWEKYSIDVDADACCGGVFEFGLDAYFKDGAGTLFELALIEADLMVNVTDKFAFTMDLDVDLVLGFTKWCLGFVVEW